MWKIQIMSAIKRRSFVFYMYISLYLHIIPGYVHDRDYPVDVFYHIFAWGKFVS